LSDKPQWCDGQLQFQLSASAPANWDGGHKQYLTDGDLPMRLTQSSTVSNPVLLRSTAGREDDRGAELFEFAVVVPLLWTLLLGAYWMGRAYNVYHTIARAAREGARCAVLPSCATCGSQYPDTYSGLNTSLDTGSNVFQNYVSPAPSASSVSPSGIPPSGSGAYCQQVVWLERSTNPGSAE